MDNHPSLLNTHAKLLASDFNKLTQIPYSPQTFTLHNTLSLSRIESVGTITSIDHKPNKFLKFTLDDGTGTITCILWLNHLTSPYFTKRNPQSVRLIADAARCQAKELGIGKVGRVRGRVGIFRGVLQVTVSDVVVERDPNVEILHWVECVRLARRCYCVKARGRYD